MDAQQRLQSLFAKHDTLAGLSSGSGAAKCELLEWIDVMRRMCSSSSCAEWLQSVAPRSAAESQDDSVERGGDHVAGGREGEEGGREEQEGQQIPFVCYYAMATLLSCKDSLLKRPGQTPAALVSVNMRVSE